MKGGPLRWEAILLAAGASTRMGEPKALLPWSGRRLLEHQVLEVLATRVYRVVVVLGAHRERLYPLVERGVRALGGRLQGGSRLVCVVNADWRSGKCSSIRCGAEAVSPEADHVLVAAVDQPLAAEVLEALLAVHAERDVEDICDYIAEYDSRKNADYVLGRVPEANVPCCST